MNTSAPTPQSPTETGNRLEHLPVTIFAILLGLFGLTLALHAATPSHPWAAGPSMAMLYVSIAAFVALALIYALKAARYPRAVFAEWHHPVKLAFFPTITISMLLMATALHGHFPAAARLVWMIGTVGQGVLTIAVVTGWISHRSFEVGHLTPAWFIPAVGNVIVPLVGAQAGFAEISWLFFSGGLIFWIVLLTLVMNRLVFHDPLPERLFPTMMILIAPPAIAFIAYISLVGHVDTFAIILLNIAYVFAALMLGQIGRLSKLSFALSWWALSFPLAALSIASFKFGHLVASAVYQRIGFSLLVLLVLVVIALTVRTIQAALRGQICQPE